MDAIQSITLFIERVVAKEKQGRYTGFIENKKNRKKFLRTLDHALISEIDLSKTVKTFSEKEWNERGFLYSSDGTFGLELESLKEGYDNAPPYGGWLILNLSAQLAIFRPEGKIDEEIYFKL